MPTWHAGVVTIRERLALRVGRDSQARAAAQLGVDQATVSRWLTGKRVPTDEHVPVLAAYLGWAPSTVARKLYEARTSRNGD
jgi:DNA-binding LacI/PurR family transcriptional regulator